MSDFVNNKEWQTDKNTLHTVCDHLHATLKHLSDHTKEGGVEKLKEEYPDRYMQVWKQLEGCWMHKGIARFQKDMTAGLKKVSKWRD